jgi:CRISPR-associated Cas5-like protein
MEEVLTFRLICPFWVSFRNHSTVNVHVTFPFPPPSTIYGLLNAARGKPQDWHADRDEWRIGLVVEYRGRLVETFSKVMKIYEDKRSAKDRAAQSQSAKGVFDRTTLIRQKLLAPRYCVYMRASPDLLQEAARALLNPHWPLYLGESDDLVDVQEPRIIGIDPSLDIRAHSIIPAIVAGCQLVNVTVKFRRIGTRWRPVRRIYSLPPESREVELPEPFQVYAVEGKKVVFDERSDGTGQA